MKIKTFVWDAVNGWETFDREVNEFIADKTVVSIHTADSLDARDSFYHTVTVVYRRKSEEIAK